MSRLRYQWLVLYGQLHEWTWCSYCEWYQYWYVNLPLCCLFIPSRRIHADGFDIQIPSSSTTTDLSCAIRLRCLVLLSGMQGCWVTWQGQLAVEERQLSIPMLLVPRWFNLSSLKELSLVFTKHLHWLRSSLVWELRTYEWDAVEWITILSLCTKFTSPLVHVSCCEW
jgi:hypothetical protein